ncbi:MAG: iron donor protein CyaY [Planctomycetota bacterium]|jgi:iron donor protein CyaY
MTEAISPREFEESARRALMAVEEALDELDDDAIDSDLVDGVLTITFADGEQFLLNVNGPALEIWLSARRRAWHFAPRGGGHFVSTAADGDGMMVWLARLVGEKLGRPVTLGGQL